MVDKKNDQLSILGQCRLLGLSRSTYYYQPQGESPYNLELMRQIDREYLKFPFFGSRQMMRHLKNMGYDVGRQRVKRLMRKMGIRAVYQKPRTSRPDISHKIYPYVLRDMEITRPNQVWCADITYIPVLRGFMYLVAVMDWYSRYVLSWRLSNTLDTGFCIESVEEAMSRYGVPDIFNTDQGSQFTSLEFTGVLKEAGAKISMDGKGRWMDNVFIERLWRSAKYECVYLNEFANGKEARCGLKEWFDFYNHVRPHSVFDGKRPMEVYWACQPGRGGHAPLSPATRLAA